MPTPTFLFQFFSCSPCYEQILPSIERFLIFLDEILNVIPEISFKFTRHCFQFSAARRQELSPESPCQWLEVQCRSDVSIRRSSLSALEIHLTLLDGPGRLPSTAKISEQLWNRQKSSDFFAPSVPPTVPFQFPLLLNIL